MVIPRCCDDDDPHHRRRSVRSPTCCPPPRCGPSWIAPRAGGTSTASACLIRRAVRWCAASWCTAWPRSICAPSSPAPRPKSMSSPRYSKTSGTKRRPKDRSSPAKTYLRTKFAGAAPEVDELAEIFEDVWNETSAEGSFQPGEDLDKLKAQTATLARMYLDEVAPEIEPAVIRGEPAIEMAVSGE